jgi:hypothetical protein
MTIKLLCIIDIRQYISYVLQIYQLIEVPLTLAHLKIFKHLVRTSKRTQSVSVTKTNWLLSFSEIIAV